MVVTALGSALNLTHLAALQCSEYQEVLGNRADRYAMISAADSRFNGITSGLPVIREEEGSLSLAS